MTDAKVDPTGFMADEIEGHGAKRDAAWTAVHHALEAVRWALEKAQRHAEQHDLTSCANFAADAAEKLTGGLFEAINRVGMIPDEPQCPDGLTKEERWDWAIEADAARARAQQRKVN